MFSKVRILVRFHIVAYLFQAYHGKGATWFSVVAAVGCTSDSSLDEYKCALKALTPYVAFTTKVNSMRCRKVMQVQRFYMEPAPRCRH